LKVKIHKSIEYTIAFLKPLALDQMSLEPSSEMIDLKGVLPFASHVDGSPAFQLSTTTILFCSLVLAFACCCLSHTWQKVISSGGIPKSIPWAGTEGAGNGPLSRARATLRSFFGMRELIQEGYNKVWN